MDLVGEVDGCDCILVDDMIDTAGTLCAAADEPRSMGARSVYAYATHGCANIDRPCWVVSPTLWLVIILGCSTTQPWTVSKPR